MAKQVGMEVSIAAAEAVKLANVDVIAAYPITPQTHIVEHLSELVADGELDAEFVPVESEHSAMSLAVGSQAAGARSFTCTSAQGLALMSEIVFIAASMRLPILMILANRSLSSPLSIWNDHSDVMSVRDCGWIQLFTENSQEVYDHVFIGYKVSENHNVLLPTIINMDGFILTHMFEPVYIEDESVVKQYLPDYVPKFSLHPDKPVTMGAFAMPTLFTEAKMAQNEALKASYPYIMEAWKQWGDLTGRYYNPIEELHTEDAETLLLTMGSFGETAGEAVKAMREQGKKVGLLKLRLWRPFPFEELRRAVSGASKLVVVDRAVSFGGPGGPAASEIRSALYDMDPRPQVHNTIAGLAGRDVTVNDFIQIVESAETKKTDDYEIYGVRG